MIKRLVVLLLLPIGLWAQSTNPDLLIVNGRIIDGTGNSWYRADIAIRDGKIQSIGNNLPRNATRILDAQNRIVAPGFIDVHTHLEDDEARDPLAHSFLYDGVTTCITGNCGLSNVNIGKYLNWIDSLKLSINVASLIGQNDIRRAVIGRANRNATPDEMKRMEQITEKAMQDGAVGLSTGLIYIPGTFTPTQELINLAKIAGRYNGVYATHMRDEGDSVTQAIEEALLIGREGNLPVQLSHFKLSGQQNWGRSKQTLNMVEEARANGQDVTIDQYPYTASSTSISTLIPDHILADGQDSIRARLKRPEVRKEVIASIQNGSRESWGVSAIRLFHRYHGHMICAANFQFGEVFAIKRCGANRFHHNEVVINLNVVERFTRDHVGDSTTHFIFRENHVVGTDLFENSTVSG